MVPTALLVFRCTQDGEGHFILWHHKPDTRDIELESRTWTQVIFLGLEACGLELATYGLGLDLRHLDLKLDVFYLNSTRKDTTFQGILSIIENPDSQL